MDLVSYELSSETVKKKTVSLPGESKRHHDATLEAQLEIFCVFQFQVADLSFKLLIFAWCIDP